MFVLICGLPRAGKTTYSKKFENVIHLDELRFMKSVQFRLRENGTGDVAVDGVYHKANDRISLLNEYKGLQKVCIWLDTPVEMKQSRRGYDSRCEYPFEPPTLEEGWDEIIIIRGEYEQRISRQTED